MNKLHVTKCNVFPETRNAFATIGNQDPVAMGAHATVKDSLAVDQGRFSGFGSRGGKQT